MRSASLCQKLPIREAPPAATSHRRVGGWTLCSQVGGDSVSAGALWMYDKVIL